MPTDNMMGAAALLLSVVNNTVIDDSTRSAVNINDTIYQFTVPDIDNNMVSLSKYRCGLHLLDTFYAQMLQ